jgi:uncharacterized protein YyaL (SSP411 family)
VLSILQSFSAAMARNPSSFGNLLGALDFALSDAREIAISGSLAEEEVRALLREVFRRYVPNKVVACGTSSGVFLLRGRGRIAGRPTAYVCRNYVCQAPVTSPADLARELES